MIPLGLVFLVFALAVVVALVVGISWRHFDLLRADNDRLNTENTTLKDRVEFEQDKTRQWADAFSTEHDARRRQWRCRTHVYGGIR